MKRITWILVAIVVAGGLLAIRMKRLHELNAAPLVHRPAPVVEVTQPSRLMTLGRGMSVEVLPSGGRRTAK